jgi:hypothetical protein
MRRLVEFAQGTRIVRTRLAYEQAIDPAYPASPGIIPPTGLLMSSPDKISVGQVAILRAKGIGFLASAGTQTP